MANAEVKVLPIDKILELALSVFPDCVISLDDDNQVIVHTNIEAQEDEAFTISKVGSDEE